MAGATPQEAVHNFITPLHGVLSCLTKPLLDLRGGYQLGAVHGVVLKQGDPTPVPGTDLAIRIGQSYEVILADPPKRPL